MELHSAVGVGGEPAGDAEVQILLVLGGKGELEDGDVGVLAHDLGDVIAHHARLPVMHDGPLDVNTTNGGGGLENNGGTCGCGCEGF